MNTHSVNDLFFTPSLVGKILGSNCLPDGCTSWVVCHRINYISCCYQWHMRGLFFPYHCDVVQHHACSDDSTSTLRTYPQATQAVEPALNDPKCHFYADPALTQSRIEATLRWCVRVRIGGH